MLGIGESNTEQDLETQQPTEFSVTGFVFAKQTRPGPLISNLCIPLSRGVLEGCYGHNFKTHCETLTLVPFQHTFHIPGLEFLLVRRLLETQVTYTRCNYTVTAEESVEEQSKNQETVRSGGCSCSIPCF